MIEFVHLPKMTVFAGYRGRDGKRHYDMRLPAPPRTHPRHCWHPQLRMGEGRREHCCLCGAWKARA